MDTAISTFVFRIHCKSSLENKVYYVFKCDFRGEENRLMLDHVGRILVCTDMEHFDRLTTLCSRRFLEVAASFVSEKEFIDVYVSDAIEHLVNEDRDSEEKLYDLLCLVDDAFQNLGADHRGCPYSESNFLQRELTNAALYVHGRRTISGFFRSEESKEVFLKELDANIRYIKSKLFVVIR